HLPYLSSQIVPNARVTWGAAAVRVLRGSADDHHRVIDGMWGDVPWFEELPGTGQHGDLTADRCRVVAVGAGKYEQRPSSDTSTVSTPAVYSAFADQSPALLVRESFGIVELESQLRELFAVEEQLVVGFAFVLVGERGPIAP